MKRCRMNGVGKTEKRKVGEFYELENNGPK